MNKTTASAAIFNALGDITRIRIIESIFDQEKSVSNISKDLNMTHSAISHQLRILKNVNIVRSKRQGKEMLYSLSDEHIKTVVEQVFTHSINCGVKL